MVCARNRRSVCFQQQEIAVLPDVAQVGELVFVVAFAFDGSSHTNTIRAPVRADRGPILASAISSSSIGGVGRTIPTAGAPGSAAVVGAAQACTAPAVVSETWIDATAMFTNLLIRSPASS